MLCNRGGQSARQSLEEGRTTCGGKSDSAEVRFFYSARREEPNKSCCFESCRAVRKSASSCDGTLCTKQSALRQSSCSENPSLLSSHCKTAATASSGASRLLVAVSWRND
ncbi:hypothetical protein ATANTOWER_020091 [Ataeniobius toweri]|uniref:Uncharacterized protein n=1 Tax=Ataeniobius toweri TaxID=208326 RepID=A0ABU7C1N4_9TELE|nr:hypothetical protein [Ataeniobius toweri]